MPIDETIQVLKTQLSSPPIQVDVKGMPPMNLVSTAEGAIASDNSFGTSDFDCPQDLVEFWGTFGRVELFVDKTYGQWGLVLLDAKQASNLSRQWKLERKDDLQCGDLIIGQFVGDSELLLIRCDRNSKDFGAVLIVSPISSRKNWDFGGASFSEFLKNYIEGAGDKFWEQNTASS